MSHLRLEGRLLEIPCGPPQDAARSDVDHQSHVIPVEKIAREGIAAVLSPRRLAPEGTAHLLLETFQGGLHLVWRLRVALHQNGRRARQAAGRRVGKQQRDARVAPDVESLVRQTDRGGYEEPSFLWSPEGQRWPGYRRLVPGKCRHLAGTKLAEDLLYLGRQTDTRIWRVRHEIASLFVATLLNRIISADLICCTICQLEPIVSGRLWVE